jgi:hypothetical protein
VPTIRKERGLDMTVGEMNKLLDVVDTLGIDGAIKLYPNIHRDKVLRANLESIDRSSLNELTVLELKLVYYKLTKDRYHNAIKTNQKQLIVNYLIEVVLSYERAVKLGVRQREQPL